MPHVLYHRNNGGGVGDELGHATYTFDGDTKELPVYSRATFYMEWSAEGLSQRDIEDADELIKRFRRELYAILAHGDEQIHYTY